MSNYDLTGLAVKMVCPNNEVITDDMGIPGVYVQRTPRILSELVTGGDGSTHPAFLVHNKQVGKLFIGKYQGKDHGSRIYSLPGEDPRVNINLDTYEQYCKNKGDGHHCITAAEWAYLALCCKKDGKIPKGNNSYGKDHSEASATAIPTATVLDTWNDPSHVGQTARVATGTGPLTWSDTGDASGIWDLNGNVWEWVSGIRLVKGELQVIPYNDAAAPDVATGASSSEWRAINADATAWSNLFVTPTGSGATANAVKLDWVTDHWQWGKTIETQADATHDCEFAKTTMVGLSDFAQMYMRAMALAPEAEAEYNGDRFWSNNGADERCAFRGGGWLDGAYAGVFSLNFNYPPSHVYLNLGGRPAFYKN